MAARPDPKRIAAAQRAGLRARLIDEGVREAEVDAWLDRWAAEHDGQFERDFAHDWIVGQVGLRRHPRRISADSD